MNNQPASSTVLYDILLEKKDNVWVKMITLNLMANLVLPSGHNPAKLSYINQLHYRISLLNKHFSQDGELFLCKCLLVFKANGAEPP